MRWLQILEIFTTAVRKSSRKMRKRKIFPLPVVAFIGFCSGRRDSFLNQPHFKVEQRKLRTLSE
jgi:uncharacterized protein YfbU (UPF0304 family)